MKIKVCKDLLPIKAHYFFFFAALGPLLPQLNVFGRQLGVSPAVMGGVTAVLPVLWALAKPAVGFVVDYFQSMRKGIFMFLIVLMSGSYCCLYFLPEPPLQLAQLSFPLLLDYWQPGDISIHSTTTLCHNKFINGTCSDDILKNLLPASCGWTCKEQLALFDQSTQFPTSKWTLHLRHDDVVANGSLPLESFYYEEPYLPSCSHFSMQEILNPNSTNINTGTSLNNTVTRRCMFRPGCHLSCAFYINDTANFTDSGYRVYGNMSTSTADVGDEYYLYGTITFWGFVIFMCVGTVAFNVANCIADAVCFDVLGPSRSMRYGSQRAWGTVGYGLTALLSGWLVDVASAHPLRKDFTPAFLLTAVFTFADLFFCRKLKSESVLQLPSMSRPAGVGGALGQLMSQPAVLAFLCFAVVAGMFDSFIIYYMFWYLEELATAMGGMDNIKLLEGLTVAVESFGGELLFFAVSGKILKRFGFGHTLTFCLVCYSLRLLLISFITRPWQILAIELVMQGPTYALCYATIVGYAAAVAPPGLSATLQGIVAGMDDGFGFALGSLLGGVLYHTFGGRRAFQIFGLIAIIAAGIHAVLRATVLKHAADKVETPQDVVLSSEEVDRLEHGNLVEGDVRQIPLPDVEMELLKGPGDGDHKLSGAIS